jgi:ATP-dependent Clp protease ATP-binding subunit ClpA
MVRIVEKFAGELAESLAERNISLGLTEAAKEYLAKEGFDPAYGARPLARVIREQVEDPLAGEMLFGKLSKGGRVTIDAIPAVPLAGEEAAGDETRPKAPGKDAKQPKMELAFRYESAPTPTAKKAVAKV